MPFPELDRHLVKVHGFLLLGRAGDGKTSYHIGEKVVKTGFSDAG
jgi:hypothetical protein